MHFIAKIKGVDFLICGGVESKSKAWESRTSFLAKFRVRLNVTSVCVGVGVLSGFHSRPHSSHSAEKVQTEKGCSSSWRLIWIPQHELITLIRAVCPVGSLLGLRTFYSLPDLNMCALGCYTTTKAGMCKEENV